MKLHLGCGQRYFEGYVNIDFPMSEHSYQEKSVADVHCDITTLKYDNNTVNEVRLHHVFEHFDRPQASALLATWNSWLADSGTVHIEVPDLDKSLKVLRSRWTSTNSKKVAIRHLFGSHEAHWAIHCEGYSEWMLTNMLENFGFKVTNVSRHDWKGTYNLEVHAIKSKNLSYNEAIVAAKNYMEGFLVDESEQALLNIWLSNFEHQLKIGWAG